MPRAAGSIQICRKCTRSVGEALNSLCRTPVPALMRCTSPGPDHGAVAHRVLVRELAFEHVADDLHVAMAVGAETLPGCTRSSLMTRSGPNPMCAGS